jgi:Domain of unknown function (DUF4386)
MTAAPVPARPLALGDPERGSTGRLAGVLLVAAVVCANVAFLGLGSVFNYPDVLQEPPGETLTKFSADQGTIVAYFSVLALGAALLGPGAVLVGRLIGGSLGRWSARIGIAAAVVQVVGLVRWPLLVPSLADRATDSGASAGARADATDNFELANDVLGTAIGETLGYLLTALWTVLVIQALRGKIAGGWFTGLGLAAAALILSGVAVPLDLPGVDAANFIGYILWSAWLVALAILLWRRPARLSAHSPREGAHD